MEASQTVSMNWVSILSKADVLGRKCSDTNELLEKIELFSEFCSEHGCYIAPRTFPDSFSRFVYFQKENGSPDYKAYDDTRLEVTLMSGLPAAGKDTWIKKYCHCLPIISLDEIREEQDVSPAEDQGEIIFLARERAKAFLRARQSFVWNATNISKSIRGQLISLFVSYGAKVKIVYLEAPYNEIMKRNRERSRNVPENVIERMIAKLEIPGPAEAHEVQWVVG